MNGLMDGWLVGWTNGWTDGRLVGHSLPWPLALSSGRSARLDVVLFDPLWCGIGQTTRRRLLGAAVFLLGCLHPAVFRGYVMGEVLVGRGEPKAKVRKGTQGKSNYLEGTDIHRNPLGDHLGAELQDSIYRPQFPSKKRKRAAVITRSQNPTC